jgi:tetratricopeptide (TPR) repeat protein
MFELDDAIRKLPGSTAAQGLLVQRALEYLQSLARDAGNDAELQREVALGYERVGIVQGYVSESNLGRLPAAVTSLEKAWEILGRLADRRPSDPSLRHDLSRVVNELSTSYGASGQLQKALDLSRTNLARAESAFQAHPSDVASMKDLTDANFIVADHLTTKQDYAEAIRLRQRGLELARKLTELRPGDRESERSLALAEKKLAALLGVSKRFEESRDAYQRARAIDERLSVQDPSSMRAKIDLSYDYSDLGWVMTQMGAYKEALVSHRRALALREEAAKADPNDLRAATAVASTTYRIGKTLLAMGDFEAAVQESQRAIGLYETLTVRSRAEWSLLVDLASAHWDIADELAAWAARRGTSAARQRELRSRSLADYGKALALLEDLREKGVLPKAQEKYIAELRGDAEKVRRESAQTRPSSGYEK